MKKTPALVFAFFALLVAPVRADDESPKLARAKSDYEKADAALNKTYQAVRAELDKTKATELRDNQRDWIEHRDDVAAFPPALGLTADDDPKKSAEYWETMTEMTRDRTEFLKIYSGKNVPGGISGEYRDSFGGALTLEEKKNGVAFSVSVVRGHSGANGELDGLARRSGDKAFFKDKPERGEDREPCEITLTFIGGHIVKLEGKNTQFYHGARAYFDGTYFKTGPLKEHIEIDKSAR
jgi:uncharacterized protein YecT (DUF1311 family)